MSQPDTGTADVLARVHGFLDAQLSADDMSLEEIAGQVITIVAEEAGLLLEGLWVRQVPVAELAPGDIVISVGRAVHLGERTGTVLGYDRWTYTVYGPDGYVYHGDKMELRHDGTANVLRLTGQTP
jgi:hypothetical protein